MTEFKEIFRLFDDDQDGVVTSDEVSVIMRSLGVSISDGELRHMISQYRAHGKDTSHVDFPEFLAMMRQCLDDAPSIDQEEQDLIEAFKVFDHHDDGRITSRELRTIMMTLGEAMDTTMVDHMIKDADIEGIGLIDYTEFVKRLLSTKPLIQSHR